MAQFMPDGRSDGSAALIVRPETVEDLALTATSHLASWRAGHTGLVPAAVLDDLDLQEWIRRRIEAFERDDGASTYVAVSAGDVVGHVTVRAFPDEPAAGQIWACYVHPRVFGAGVADELMRHGLGRLSQPVVRLWVARDNARAVAFYQRHRFLADGAESMYKLRQAEAELPLIRMTLNR